MKKALLIIVAGIMGGELPAFANVDRSTQLTPLQKQQIAWALQILKKTKTIEFNPEKGLQIDEDILKILEKEKRIQSVDDAVAVICIGS